jgi:hypothetical protein
LFSPDAWSIITASALSSLVSHSIVVHRITIGCKASIVLRISRLLIDQMFRQRLGLILHVVLDLVRLYLESLATLITGTCRTFLWSQILLQEIREEARPVKVVAIAL